MDPMRMSAEEFVARLVDRPQHTEYAMFLGAGCSIASGIPTAGMLVSETWLPRLYAYRGRRSGASFEEWVADAFPTYSPDNPALSYGPVMEALFPRKHDKQREVERICRGRDPGFGCCVLAKLIEREAPDFNVILTTNFDDLLADALYLFTASRPLVIPHAALASFMRPNFERPLVAKLHGDHQLEPLNTREELTELNQAVRARLHSLLQQRGLVVMGYAGNDDSIMDAFEQLPVEDSLGPGIWWVSRSAPNKRVRDWLVRRKGHWVESADFDQLMLLFQQHFDLPHPEIERWKQVHDRYFESFSGLRTTVERMSQSEPSASALKQASVEALERVSDWWSFELRARPLKTSDPDAAERIYREGIERLPNSAELLGSYAVFLKKVRKDADAAETFYRRAIEADPSNPTNLGNYALFLTGVRRDQDAAETFYRRAIEADPKHTNSLGNYALFLATVRHDAAAAERYFRQALELDPNYVNTLTNYAIFLANVRHDADMAETYFRRAVEADPSHPGCLGSYAVFLKNVRKDADAAETFYKRAIDADPHDVFNLRNYALFLKSMRNDADAAETFYKRAIDADPHDVDSLGGYANLLTAARKDPSAAARLYRQALDADPDHANNLGNYARHLIWVGRAADAWEYVDRAFARAGEDEQPLVAELWFYRYANGTAGERDAALAAVKRLLVAGARSPGWDLAGNIERAQEAGHPEIDWLAPLAAVLADEAPIESLAGWEAWQAA